METNATAKPVKQLDSLVPEHKKFEYDDAHGKPRCRVRVQKAPWSAANLTLPGGHMVNTTEIVDVIMDRDAYDALRADPSVLADPDEPERQRVCLERYKNAIAKIDGLLHRRLCGVSAEWERASVRDVRKLYDLAKSSPGEVSAEIQAAIAYAENTSSLHPAVFRHAMLVDGEAPSAAGSWVMFEAIEDLAPRKSPQRVEAELGTLEQQPLLAQAVAKAVAEGLAAAFGPLLAQLNPNGANKSKGG